MLKTDFLQYLKQQQYRQLAWRWLRANDDVALAAHLMFHLNQYAGYTQRLDAKNYIYNLKNCFVRYLYENGYGYQAKQQVQTLRCNTCFGTGIYRNFGDEDECWYCGGAGIYRQTILYQFFFNVNGQTYIWHQPAPLVWWSVVLENEMPGEWQAPKKDNSRFLDINQVELYSLTLLEFLRRHRATEYRRRIWTKDGQVREVHQVKPPITIGRIVRGQWRRIEYKAGWQWRRLKRYFAKPVPIARQLIDDDIPF